jgi:ADP-heptose:LPS heptosyltransferase
MKSILAIQLKRIGDVILTMPALRAMRKLYPEAPIVLLLDEGSAAIAPALGSVDEIWTFRRRSSLKLWFDLLRRGFDLCLDFTGNDRSALVSFLSTAGRRIGFKFVTKRPGRSWVYTDLVQSPPGERHTVDHYIDLVRSLGEVDPAGGLSLKLPASVQRSAETLRRELGVPGPYFVVHPGTARPEKYWLADRWAVAITYTQQHLRLPCLITGGRDPAELRHVSDILARLKDASSVYSLAGKIDVVLSAAMIRDGALFAGVDTAAAHVASAFARPQLVLFGPTNPFHWHPRHDSAVVVRAGFAEPLEQFEPRQEGFPMRDLSTETVIRGMETLFNYVKVQ